MLYDDLVQPGEYICHHGVKGQKWGVRHEKETSNDTIHFSTKKNKVPKLKFKGYKSGSGKPGLSTNYKGKTISFLIGDNQMNENMNTTFKLIENWENVNKMVQKCFNDVRDDIRTYYNVDMTNDSVSEFFVDGKTAFALYRNERGILDIEIDPTTYVVYGANFSD